MCTKSIRNCSDARSVAHLIERYEELVTVHVTDRDRIHEKLKKQGRVILAIDGLQPDAAHEVLWVIRDCLSQEILLAGPLLSSAQADITTLLREVKEQLPSVAVKGIVKDRVRRQINLGSDHESNLARLLGHVH